MAVGDRTRGFPGDFSPNTHLASWSTREGCAGCSLKCWERREGASGTVRPPPGRGLASGFYVSPGGVIGAQDFEERLSAPCMAGAWCCHGSLCHPGSQTRRLSSALRSGPRAGASLAVPRVCEAHGRDPRQGVMKLLWMSSV